MTDLVLLKFENGEFVRCVDLDDAKKKAIFHSSVAGRILVEITPEGSGLMTRLEFGRNSRDWIAAS